MSKWKVTALGEIATIVAGSTPKTSINEYWNGEYNWVTPAEISDSTNVIYDTERKITEKAIKDTSLKILPIGTVLLSSRAPIGKVAITGVEMYCNQGFKNLICSEKIFNKYLFWFLKGRTEFLNSLGRGATFKEISKTIVQKIEIPLPPLESQKQIAKTLDTVAELLSMRKQQLSELDNLIKSTFYDMFGDPVFNEKGWKVSNLGECCYLIKDGPHVSPNYVEDGIPFVSVNNIIKGYWDLEKVKYISREDYEKFSKRCKPEYGDVLYTKGGTTGYAKYVDRDFEFMNWVHIAVLKYKKEILNGIFLENMLNSNFCYDQSQQYTRGIANRDLVLSQMSKIILFVPPLKLQNQFASIVNKIEEQKALVKKAIDETQYLFDTLMSKYLD